MKRILILTLVTILILLSIACSGDSKNDVEVQSYIQGEMPKASGKTLVIGTMANALGLPVYVAEAKGYFDEVGLDVKVEVFATGAPINEAMASGDIDIAVSGMAAVYGLGTGMYTYIGDGVMTTGGESIYARADSDIVRSGTNEKGVIGSTETIKNASILGPLATTAHYQAIQYVESFGLTSEDFDMVSMDYAASYQAFITGEGDLIAIKIPFSNQLEEAGYVMVSDMSMVLDEPIIDSIFTQNDIAKERAGDIELFLYAYYKACKDLMNNETSRREIAHKWYDEQGIAYSASDMDMEIDVKEYFTLDNVDSDEAPLGKFYINLGDFYVGEDMIEEADLPNIEASIDNSYLNNIKKWADK